MLLLFMITVFIIIVATVWWAGFWSNTVMFFNMLIGALVATAFYGNIASAFLDVDMSWNFVAPFVSIWSLFFITTGIIRAGTDALSRIKLKFDVVTEMVGRSLMSIAVGLLFISFASFTMHMAPIPPNFLGDPSGGVGKTNTVRVFRAPLYVFPPGDIPAEARQSMSDEVELIGPEKLWELATIYWSNWTLAESFEYCLVDRLRELRNFPVDTESLPRLGYRPWPRATLAEYAEWRKSLAGTTNMRIETKQ